MTSNLWQNIVKALSYCRGTACRAQRQAPSDPEGHGTPCPYKSASLKAQHCRAKIQRIVLATICGCLLANTVFADVVASTDRTQVPEGESLQLTLRSDDPYSNQNPNIDVLNRDFDLLSRIQSTQMSVMNGKKTANRQWVYVLVPKHTGQITIPAIAIGQYQTKPISIIVTQANDPQAPVANRNVFLTASVTPNTPYVQSQALYTLKLYYDAQIANPELKEPNSPQAKVFQVGKPSSYASTVNGRRYQVMEIHFAVLPQSSGNIQLQPAEFTGNLSSQSTQGYYGPTWRPLRVGAPSTTLIAKPIPSNLTNGWWLPASKVTISERYQPDLSTVKAGDPVTRIITVTATGTTAENLPKVSNDSIPGASVYLDKPNVNTQTVGDNLVATRIERMVIIPTAKGQITIPPITVSWFNTQTNTVDTTSLPARTLTVSANAAINQGSPLPPMAIPSTNTTTIATPIDQAPPTQATSLQHNRWFWLTILALLLWIVTLVALWLTHQRAKRILQNSDDLPRRQLVATTQRLAKCNDAIAFSHKLLSLAQHVWPQAQIHQLGDLKPYLNDAGKQAIDELNQQLYHHTPQPWDGASAWHLLKPQLLNKYATEKSSSHLPPVYPKDNHEARD